MNSQSTRKAQRTPEAQSARKARPSALFADLTATTRTRRIRETHARRRSGRSVLRRTLWVLQILIAAFLLIASAAPKFAGQRYAVETFAKIGWGQWFRYVTGAVEAAGAIGLLVPRLAGLAATGLIGLMIGAIITQIFVLVPAFALLPAGFAVVFALVAYDRRDETRRLLTGLRR